MLSYLLILSLITIAFSLEPSCVSCKWFIPKPNNNLNAELGLCQTFKTTCYNKDGKGYILHNFATHCRNDEHLCGKSGFFYKSKDESVKNVSETSEILNDYDELSNRCCGEVNETVELEQLERDFLEIYQKIKKHNKKMIFSASKDLYKFFRKSD